MGRPVPGQGGERDGQRSSGRVGLLVGAEVCQHLLPGLGALHRRGSGITLPPGGISRGVQCGGPVEHDGPVGQRAGLIEADHVHARQNLHSRLLLNEHLLLGQLHRCHSEGDRGHQRQTLRNHRRHRRDRCHQRIAPETGAKGQSPPAVSLHLAVEHHSGDRHQHQREPEGDALQSTPDLGVDLQVLLRLSRQPDRMGPLTDCGHHEPAGSGQHPGAGEDRIPATFGDGLGLTGEHRLIQVKTNS